MDKKTILGQIVKHLKEMLPDINVQEINENSILCLLGAGSVERAELIERMLEELNLQADRFDFHKANNLGELATLLLTTYQLENKL